MDGPRASLLAAMGMAFSPLFHLGLLNGYITENITFPFFIISLGFFLRASFFPDSNTWKNVFLAGIALGWMFLAGGSFLYLYAVLFYFLYMVIESLYKIIILRTHIREIFLHWIQSGSMLLTSVCLAAIQFFPAFLFMSQETGRQYYSYETMIGQVIPLSHYIKECVSNYPSFLAYAFFAIVLFGIWALKIKNKCQDKFFLFGLLCLLFLWITWGRAAPIDIYYVIYKFFPGFKNNHDTTRFRKVGFDFGTF